jgi:hypothetical protein
MNGFCPSHEALEAASKRQEGILEQIRKENAEHRLHMVTALTELSERMQALSEIKATIRQHNERRDDDTRGCEEKRTEIWLALNDMKSRMDKRDGTALLVGTICTTLGGFIGWLVTVIFKNPPSAGPLVH